MNINQILRKCFNLNMAKVSGSLSPWSEVERRKEWGGTVKDHSLVWHCQPQGCSRKSTSHYLGAKQGSWRVPVTIYFPSPAWTERTRGQTDSGHQCSASDTGANSLHGRIWAATSQGMKCRSWFSHSIYNRKNNSLFIFSNILLGEFDLIPNNV